MMRFSRSIISLLLAFGAVWSCAVSASASTDQGLSGKDCLRFQKRYRVVAVPGKGFRATEKTQTVVDVMNFFLWHYGSPSMEGFGVPAAGASGFMAPPSYAREAAARAEYRKQRPEEPLPELTVEWVLDHPAGALAIMDALSDGGAIFDNWGRVTQAWNTYQTARQLQY